MANCSLSAPVSAASWQPTRCRLCRWLWGSFFSRVDGHAMKTPFRRGLFSSIVLRAGAPLAADVTPAQLREQVRALRGAP
jgi:hypothetical protein